MAERFVAKRNERYAKLGGGDTDDISEAQILGWANKRSYRWANHELVPVTIVPTREYGILLEANYRYGMSIK